ncbi:iron permease [Peniophora sp. CONT]|nr:iron permease [Peniophora sp. CONT]
MDGFIRWTSSAHDVRGRYSFPFCLRQSTAHSYTRVRVIRKLRFRYTAELNCRVQPSLPMASHNPASDPDMFSTSGSPVPKPEQDVPPTGAVEGTSPPDQTAWSWSTVGLNFWMLLVATLTCDFLSAFDLGAISTTLPTIVQDLHGASFIWAGSAYPLAATALIPLCGGLVSIFGRKPVLLSCITLFAIGSALAGSAHSMGMLIAARAVQGLGSGGCLATTEIIYADLVPLPQRGIIQGITAVMWAFATAAGPIVGGALAKSGAWRWLFYLNLPIAGVALFLIIIFYRVRSPKLSFKDKVSGIDWVGGLFVVGGSASLTVALTWGGVQFPWSSAQSIVPLVVGVVALIVFTFIERYFSSNPIIPWRVVNNRTSLSGYLGTAVHGIVSFAVIYYLPVYFQAVQGASPVRSGVDFLGMMAFITPSCMIVGASVQIFNCYRPQNYVGWGLIVVGFGVLTLLDSDSSKATYIGCQIILGIGLGIIWISTQFAILAPLPFSNNAHALAFFTFVRSLSQTIGVAVGGSILQNVLRAKLPTAFVEELPSGVALAYAIIPKISALPEPLRGQVRNAFSDSLKTIWQTMTGIAGAGLLSVCLMDEVEMRTDVDSQWALEDTKDMGDRGQGSPSV